MSAYRWQSRGSQAYSANYPSFPIASVGQTSMALCAAAISSGVSGCLEKCTAVSSRLYVKRFGASSRQRRHNAQLVSTYHGPGAFSDCLLRLSAIFQPNAWLTAKIVTSDLGRILALPLSNGRSFWQLRPKVTATLLFRSSPNRRPTLLYHLLVVTGPKDKISPQDAKNSNQESNQKRTKGERIRQQV
jgi:hypothetical protein